MLEKTKSKASEIKAEFNRKTEEKARIKREQQEREARLEAEHKKAERDKLMSMSEKELLVEVILSLRQHNSNLEEIKKTCGDIEISVGTIYSRLS